MTKIPSYQTIKQENKDHKKYYDLEERTYQFAKKAAFYCKKLSQTLSNIEYSKQLVKASGSVGANYIEANESLSKKDFIFRTKICCKESAYWLRLIMDTNSEIFRDEGSFLRNEAIELKKIFSSIIHNAL